MIVLPWVGSATAQMLAPNALPGTAEDAAFDAFAPTVNLERPELVFVYKAGGHGGSSVGFHAAEPGGRKFVTFAAFNTSSDPEAEVVSYRLSRFLGYSETYNPVTYVTLGPKAVQRFKGLLLGFNEVDKDRHVNWVSNLKQVNEHPNYLFGILRSRPRGTIYRDITFGTQGNFNTGNPLAAKMQASGVMPTEKIVSLQGVKGLFPDFPKPVTTESELLRELSNIMLIDQLTGQWDRFWKNLEVRGDQTGRLLLLARDNGGATVDDWEWHDKYEKWFSRYDHEVIGKLRDLHAFLHGKLKQLGTFDSVEKWKTTIGFIKASSYATFKAKLDRLVEKRLPALEAQYKDRVYFARPQLKAALLTTPPAAVAAPPVTTAAIASAVVPGPPAVDAKGEDEKPAALAAAIAPKIEVLKIEAPKIEAPRVVAAPAAVAKPKAKIHSSRPRRAAAVAVKHSGTSPFDPFSASK